MMKYVYIGVAVLILLMGGLIRYQYKDNQKLVGKNTVLEASNESQRKKISQFANRPRTDDDVVQRLCKWAGAVNGSKSGAERIVLGGPCDRIP